MIWKPQSQSKFGGTRDGDTVKSGEIERDSMLDEPRRRGERKTRDRAGGGRERQKAGS